jgi:hypothetical protein
LVFLALERRLRRRPVLWVRKNTLRSRRAADPFERLTALALRVLTSSTDTRSIPTRVGLLTAKDGSDKEG